jgi:hypothetical protein
MMIMMTGTIDVLGYHSVSDLAQMCLLALA